MPGPRAEAGLAALRIPGPCDFVKAAAPLAIVMLTLEILHFFGIRVAVPGLPLLAAIVCTGFSAGMRAGLIAAAVSILYDLLWFGYASEDGILRVGVFSISAVITAVLVGMLRNRVEATTYALAHHRAVEMWKTESASLQSVLHQVPLGVLLADAASGDITFANEKARSILGDDIQRLHSVGFPSMSHIDSGRSYSPHEWPLRRCVAARMVIEEEFLYARENGQLAAIHARTCPIYDHAGQVIAAVMSLTESAEKKRFERHLVEVALKVESSEVPDLNTYRFREYRSA
jgi:PAS domain-containing protein